jgi:hypothetical protein
VETLAKQIPSQGSIEGTFIFFATYRPPISGGIQARAEACAVETGDRRVMRPAIAILIVLAVALLHPYVDAGSDSDDALADAGLMEE